MAFSFRHGWRLKVLNFASLKYIQRQQSLKHCMNSLLIWGGLNTNKSPDSEAGEGGG